MPVACEKAYLTGADGSLWFRLPGGSTPLASDKFAGHIILVGVHHPYKVGEVVRFTAVDGATLPDGIVQDKDYYVVSVDDPVPGAIKVSDVDGGTPVVMSIQDAPYANANVVCATLTGGDYDNSDISNGTDSLCTDAPDFDSPAFDPGTVDYDNADVTPRFFIDVPLGPAGSGLGHVEMAAANAIVCYVREFSVEVSRQELDVTQLRTEFTDVNRYGNFRRSQAGYASCTGSVSVLLTAQEELLTLDMIKSVLYRDQCGARLRLYVNTVVDAGVVDEAASIYLDFPCSLTGVTLSGSGDEATTAEITFAARERPTGLP